MADPTMPNARGMPVARVRTDRVEIAGVRDGGRVLGHLAASRPPAAVPEETLVVDGRSAVTPSQMVERKLEAILRRASRPASYLRMRGPARAGR